MAKLPWPFRCFERILCCESVAEAGDFTYFAMRAIVAMQAVVANILPIFGLA